MAAGFGSLRRFNDVFKKQVPPCADCFARQPTGATRRNNVITISLGYRPPYQWQRMLDFLACARLSGVETTRDGEYLRTRASETEERSHVYGWVRVGPPAARQRVNRNRGLLPSSGVDPCVGRIRHLFDLYCDPMRYMKFSGR